jgi:hypothetical protein
MKHTSDNGRRLGPSGKFYEIKRGRLGWSAVLYDNSGHSINVINGDSAEEVRGAAQQHWPDVPETRPGRGIGPMHEAHRYKIPPERRQFVSPRVADFNSLDDLITHARDELGATHVLDVGTGSQREVILFFPRGGQHPYEMARTWRKGSYWHAEGPGSRTGVEGIPRGAKAIAPQEMRRASEARRRTGAPLIDDKLYSVTWNGGRAGPMSAQDVVAKVQELRQSWRESGRPGILNISVYYRDGSLVPYADLERRVSSVSETRVRDYAAIDNHGRTERASQETRERRSAHHRPRKTR